MSSGGTRLAGLVDGYVPCMSRDEEIQEIEAERASRLAPENRPEGAEVDNTGENMPEVAKQAESDGSSEGTADPGKFFRENPPSEEEVREIEAERERRLAPENRPEGAEVDNTEHLADEEAAG